MKRKPKEYETKWRHLNTLSSHVYDKIKTYAFGTLLALYLGGGNKRCLRMTKLPGFFKSRGWNAATFRPPTGTAVTCTAFDVMPPKAKAKGNQMPDFDALSDLLAEQMCHCGYIPCRCSPVDIVTNQLSEMFREAECKCCWSLPKPMYTYILYWLDGTVEEVRGATIDEAFFKAGYGSGAINALNHFQVRSTT